MEKYTKDNYKEKLKGICVVEISGEGCANCLSLMPVLYSICSDRDDCKLVHIEATEDQDSVDLMEALDVVTAPTILIMNDGVEKFRCKGYQPEEILELWIDAKIEEVKREISK